MQANEISFVKKCQHIQKLYFLPFKPEIFQILTRISIGVCGLKITKTKIHPQK